MDQQIKSKQRVADHGEVFTAEREVNAMLDLVKQETERIDSTFLEPACGTGNFWWKSYGESWLWLSVSTIPAVEVVMIMNCKP